MHRRLILEQYRNGSAPAASAMMWARLLVCGLTCVAVGICNADVRSGMVGVVPDRAPSSDIVQRLQRDVQSGGKDAQYHLALLHYYGQGVSLDHATAMRLFRDAALQGHPQAATNLAYMLEHGQACTPDSSAAFAWYSAAAEGGERQGMHGAALMLYEARVPHYDEHERIADAFNLFERAVAKRHPASYYYLGVLYEYGAHKPQNFTLAGRLYVEGCAEMGDPDCCFNLGLLHSFGRGVEQNYQAAISIFQSCYTSHGQHPGCALYLGLMYAAGQGVAVDYDLALLYLQQAADSGDHRFVSQAHEGYHRLLGLIEEAKRLESSTLATLKSGLSSPISDVGGDGMGGSAAERQALTYPADRDEF